MNAQCFTCNTATPFATLILLQLLHLSKGALCATNATKAYRLVAVLHKDRRCKDANVQNFTRSLKTPPQVNNPHIERAIFAESWK
jgi:hypothetical protein